MNKFIFALFLIVGFVNHEGVASSPQAQVPASGERQRPRFSFNGLKGILKTSDSSSSQAPIKPLASVSVADQVPKAIDVNPIIPEPVQIFRPLSLSLSSNALISERSSSAVAPESSCSASQSVCTPSDSVFSPDSLSRSIVSPYNQSQRASVVSRRASTVSFEDTMANDTRDMVSPTPPPCLLVAPQPAVAAAAAPEPIRPAKSLTPPPVETKSTAHIAYYLHVQPASSSYPAQWNRVAPKIKQAFTSFKALLGRPSQSNTPASRIINTLLQVDPSAELRAFIPVIREIEQTTGIKCVEAMHIISKDNLDHPLCSSYSHNFNELSNGRHAVTLQLNVEADKAELLKLFIQNASLRTQTNRSTMPNALSRSLLHQPNVTISASATYYDAATKEETTL